AFVGRGDELAKLDAHLERARRGQGGLVLLEAQSGGGKSRLLLELAQRCARQGVWVLRGQGLNQAAQRPFQLLVGVAAQIIAAGRFEGALAETIRDRLGEQREAVCAAFPELTEVLGSCTSEVLGPETFGQARTQEALATL